MLLGLDNLKGAHVRWFTFKTFTPSLLSRRGGYRHLKLTDWRFVEDCSAYYSSHPEERHFKRNTPILALLYV